MSVVKKSKLDLIVRVRYSNPLPPPPAPPKLLVIPTDPKRYARPDFLDALAADAPLPMIVDAEMGLPLDLSRWDALWDDAADDSEMNPDPQRLPRLDPKDAYLMGDAGGPATFAGAGASGFSAPVSSGPSTPAPAAFVPWLRKTEYISRESRSNATTNEPRQETHAPIDVSHAAQLKDIETSFAAASDDAFDLKTLKHPTKNVTAVESYEVLPDEDIWANAYDLFRFGERPGDRPADVDDPRLDCAILRPIESEGDHFLAYYLTKEDDAAIAFKQKRVNSAENGEEEETPTTFHFVRDYEVVKVEQDVPNEFVIMIDDGAAAEDLYGEATAPRRRRGAYYKGLERKMQLKKKRGQEAYADKWDVVHVQHAPMSAEEADERAETRAEVVDPLYLTRLAAGADRDADGEADAEGEPDQDAEADMDESALVRDRLVANGFDDAVDVVGGA